MKEKREWVSMPWTELTPKMAWRSRTKRMAMPRSPSRDAMRADQLGMVVRARVGEWTAIEVGQGYREAGGRRPLQTKASCARLDSRGRLPVRVCVGDTGDCPDVGSAPARCCGLESGSMMFGYESRLLRDGVSVPAGAHYFWAEEDARDRAADWEGSERFQARVE